MKPSLIRHWIDAKPHGTESGRRFQSVNPEDGTVVAEALRGGADDVDKAVDAAHRAAEPMAQTTPSERETILLQAAALLQRDADEFCDLLIREIGSPIGKAKMEIEIATRLLKANAGITRRLTGRTYPSDIQGRWSLGFRRPIGVVAGITPFNVPLIKGVKQASTSLATGNTFVWLPSEHTPAIADRTARLFHEAGVPPGAMNVVFGDGSEIGDHLVSDARVAAVTFTGSERVGRHVQSICGAEGKRVTLELGGKNPLVVLSDADLPTAIQAAIRGGFIYQGQICMASSRIIVARSVYQAFLDGFVAAASGLSLGPLREPTTMIGPLIDSQTCDRIRERLRQAVERGAKICCGGQWSGNRLHPTVIIDVDEDMLLLREEIFGPVVTVEGANDVDHAINLAASAPGILSAAVHTASLATAMEFAQRLPTAMLHINDSTLQQEPEVPFGGDGASGFGREGMETALDDFTRWQWVTMRGV
ncbi:aldehyde dehydrogenase family protein [Roseiconus nitratireducens]|uniref:aldehyde dehydrogenase family protein n=1 Tax=Roseiconus nitratireducens TaxID=2605748 RepID=UPI0013762DE3|nr:aldehyde dehydrogenase family protein [Roseiconus nitratireducens]